jgi:hypothetical protein
MASILQTSSMRRRRRNGETASSSPIGLSTANDDVAEKEWDDSCKATQRLGAATKFISAGETIPVLGGHTSGVDHALALSLLIVALAVRFFRLSEVQSVVFDEGTLQMHSTVYIQAWISGKVSDSLRFLLAPSVTRQCTMVSSQTGSCPESTSST